ncbi:MAG TPA: hypothetical protein PLT70_05100 [bacterium]|nr:hypothetical protein [bacterium]HPM45997.1 hypothetical protein [bacterium]HQN74254.1 hypothetical protein [bacterium]
MKKLSTLIAFLLLLAVIYPFYHVRKHLMENDKPLVETIEAYPEPDFAKVMFLGLNAFTADLLFTRSQYYYGSHYVTDRTYPLLEQMTKVIMALNPDLKFVIRFAEAAISSMRTPEAIESANSLLRLGAELYPDDYEFVFNQGYNYYIYLGEMEKAYPLMYKGARMEGAPERLFWMVSRVTTMGGGYRLGYEYTKEKLSQTKDKNMKDQLEKELKHFENLIYLTEAVDKYIQEYQKSPDNDLTELIKKKIVKNIPADVFGGKYFFDDKDGKVKTTTDGERYYLETQKRKREQELKELKSKEEPEILKSE